MGAKDTKAKEFLSDNERFADLFNYYLYDGRQVIKAVDLQEQDTTQVLSFFGAGKREIQKQKWRDILKSAIIKTTEYGIFVLLGVENQGDIHYAMPVKNMVYDAMEYSSQVYEATKLHRKEKDFADSAEFLPGFKREEKEGKMDMCKAWNDHRMSGVIEGKKEGKEIINQLIICLIKDGRQDDLIRAASDPAYQEELIEFYGLDKQEEAMEV